MTGDLGDMNLLIEDKNSHNKYLPTYFATLKLRAKEGMLENAICWSTLYLLFLHKQVHTCIPSDKWRAGLSSLLEKNPAVEKPKIVVSAFLKGQTYLPIFRREVAPPLITFSARIYTSRRAPCVMLLITLVNAYFTYSSNSAQIWEFYERNWVILRGRGGAGIFIIGKMR